jgi:phosphoribosylamine-glycine ligase
VRILLASSHGIGAWFLIRLLEEGNQCEWYFVEDPKPPGAKRTLRGLIPPPLDKAPDFSKYDLVFFDCTGHPEIAEQSLKVTPTIGDNALASRLEDDRLFGIEAMEQCGIEVPRYEAFSNTEAARRFIHRYPNRYVYKPFEIPGEEDQDTSATYVADSPEDMLKRLDQLFEQTMHAPFLLQSYVDGLEVSTEGWFDGEQFFAINHTLEKKKLMSGDYGPQTGCAGNLVWNVDQPTKLFRQGLGRAQQYLADRNFRGMIDLNTIVCRNHALGLEWTPRAGFDASATLFTTIQEHEQFFTEFLYRIATGNIGYQERVPTLRATFGASQRYSLPPYPEEVPGRHLRNVPIKGIHPPSIPHHWFLYDAMHDEEEGEEALCTCGSTGLVCCPIAPGHTPEGAWKGVRDLSKNLKFANLQVRDDLEECTIKLYNELKEHGWI